MIFDVPELDAAEEAAIAKIDELGRTLRWRTAAPHRRWLGGLRRLTFAKAVQASNSIEGYDASLDDVIAAVGRGTARRENRNHPGAPGLSRCDDLRTSARR